MVVVGGGLIGSETALYLAQKGHQVTLTSRQANILTDMGFANRGMLLKMMREHNVQVMTSCWPVRIEAGGILMKCNDQEMIVPGESLVSAARMLPCNELQTALSDKGVELYAIGDCVEPRRIINAVWEAFHTARKIEG